VGRSFHVSAGVTLLSVGTRVLRLLIDDEESKGSRRRFAHGLARLSGHDFVSKDGVLIAASVISGYEFQVACHCCAFFSFLKFGSAFPANCTPINRGCRPMSVSRGAREIL